MTYAGVVNGAMKSARQGAASSLAPWMATVAAAERSATGTVASAGNAFEVAAAPLARSANDGVVNAAHGYVGGVIGAWTPYQQGVATQWQGDQHARIGAFSGLAGSSRSARTAQAQADRASWNTFASSAAPAEDGLISAWANQQKSQAVLNSVTQFNNLGSEMVGQEPFLKNTWIRYL